MEIIVQKSDDIALIFPFRVNDLIRLGRNSDGGYFVTESSLENIDLVLALGIGDDWSFEEEAYKMIKSVNVVGSDFTITKKILRNLLLKEILKFFLFKSSYKNLKEQIFFNFRYNSFYGKKAINLEKRVSKKDEGIDITLQTLLNKYSNFKNILLKMGLGGDGAEYYTLNTIIENRNKIPIACIRLHDCSTHSLSFISYLNKMINYYDIVHTHINNNGGIINARPEVYEITFQRKDLNNIYKNVSNEKIDNLPLDNEHISNPDKKNIYLRLKD